MSQALILLLGFLGGTPQRPITTPRGGWVAPEVEFLVDGQPVFLEEYKEIQANVAIPPAFWDARQWKAARGTRGTGG